MFIREIEDRYRMLKEEVEVFAEQNGYRFEIRDIPAAELVQVVFYDGAHEYIRYVDLSDGDPDFGFVIDKIILNASRYFSIFANTKKQDALRIKDVIFNDPATIVFWEDGTKTVVKVQDGEIYDPEKGLAMAICKKALGNQGNYYNVFNEWCPWLKYEKDSVVEIRFDGKALAEADNKLEDVIREITKRIIKELTKNNN